jgi:hypothetical protein
MNTTSSIQQKKQSIDKLSAQVIVAQGEVNAYQAIVTSLTEKQTKLTNQVNQAAANESSAWNNKNSIEALVADIKDLDTRSKSTIAKMTQANVFLESSATQVNLVMNKLIYCVEIINKLSTLIMNRKPPKSLIPESLIQRVTKVQTDANNAISLTLTALQSVFTAQATSYESLALLQTGYQDLTTLTKRITLGEGAKNSEQLTSGEKITKDNMNNSLEAYLFVAYQIAAFMHKQSKTALADTNKLLKGAQNSLNNAQTKLSSLEAGLAAANAAALAS